MLGDQAAKQKTTTFKSIRKRRKTVAFAEPTYVDYSDFDYSSDEDDIDELFGPGPADPQNQGQESAQAADNEPSDETAKVEPLKTRQKDEKVEDSEKIEPIAEDGEEEPRGSDEMDGTREPSRSRNGTVRNTDSFYKDETVETKKITLTPNLLRDDSAASRPSTDSNKTDKSRPSLESKMERELVADKDKKKQQKDKEKQSKDKKPGAFRSFFSRKDKKKSNEDEDDVSLGKPSMDMSEPRDSEEPVMVDEPASPDRANSQRQPNKLTKQQPRLDSSLGKKVPGSSQPKSPDVEVAPLYLEETPNNVSNVPPASMRIVDPETQETQDVPSNQQNGAKALANPQMAAKTTTRMDLDDSDSSSEVEAVLQEDGVLDTSQNDQLQDERDQQQLATDDRKEKLLRPKLPGAFPDSYQTVSTISSDRTITPQQVQPGQFHPNNPFYQSNYQQSTQPPALVADTASQDGHSPDEAPSPEFPIARQISHETTSSQSKDQWDDVKLRAFFDANDHVRDLLAVVYDTRDVVPAGKDHPVVGGLFREQNAKLAEITTVRSHISFSHSWRGPLY